jgi:hypothetical protein
MPLARAFGWERAGAGLVVCPKTMPIRINLLAEAQTAEELRRKNPVKRGIWIGGFLVCVVVMWIGNLQWKIILERHDYNTIEADWQTNMAKYSIVTNEQVKIMEVDQKLAQLDDLSTNRFLWAPVLNALQQAMVDQVEVTRLRGEQSVSREDAHDTGSGTNKQHFPAAMVEKTRLSIDAKDLRPGNENYIRFKKSLSTFDFFATRLQRHGFIMDGILGQLTVDPVDPSRQFVTFTLAAEFPEVRHNE